jgi:uncharacterized protein (DUF488 family)
MAGSTTRQAPEGAMPNPIFTIGHSTHTFEEFLVLLQAHNVNSLVDIRSLPGSRKFPQFNSENLQTQLPPHGISYELMKDLGGRRKVAPDSINTGWTHKAFRAYADYMATPEFAAALDHLVHHCKDKTCAIMCAEAVPWRCHRNLVSDALVMLKAIPVFHIMSKTKANPHRPMSFAQVQNGHLIYPAPDELFSPEK